MQMDLIKFCSTKSINAVEGCYYAIILIDMDRLSCINFTYGHSAGDCLLDKTSKMLTELFGKGNWCGPFSDEYIVMIDVLNLEIGQYLCQTLLKGIATIEVACQDRVAQTTASIALGVFPKQHLDALELILHLRRLMFRVKRAGGDCIGILPPIEEGM